MKKALFLAAVSAACCGFAPIRYDRLYHAIAMVESDNGRTSQNVHQLTTRYVRDVERLSGEDCIGCKVYWDRSEQERVMRLFWTYYGSRYEARTGRAVTAEVLAKMHRVGYMGLWTRKATADAYWRRVRRFYEGGAK